MTEPEGGERTISAAEGSSNENELLFGNTPRLRVSQMRWVAFAVYFLHITLTNWLWFSYSSIPEVMVCFYQVDLSWVNALSWTFMAVYVIGIIPVMWFEGRVNLKTVAIIGAVLNLAAAWLRVFGSKPGPTFFWFLFVGSLFASIPNLIEWSAPSSLSSIWFPSNERGFSTAVLAAVAPQFGIMMGLLLTPMVITDSSTDKVCNMSKLIGDKVDSNLSRSSEHLTWEANISSQFFYYHLSQGIISLLLIPLTFMMKASPPSPPSIAEKSKKKASKSRFWLDLLSLMKNKSFLMFLCVSGIFIGAHDAILTVYEEILLMVNYDFNEGVAYLGLAIQVMSILSLIGVGFFIDRTKAFYCFLITICMSTTITTGIFQVSIQAHLHFYFVCMMSVFAVSLVVSFQAVAYEYAVEITYPVPEIMSSGLLNGLAEVFSIMIVLVIEEMVQSPMAEYCCWLLVGLFFFGSILMMFIYPELRRVKLEAKPKLVCCVTCYQTNKTK